MDSNAFADELTAAYSANRAIEAPSSRDAGFDLTMAYAVEAELARRRRVGGHTTVGRKVGYANKAMWRALKLETLVWAHMYDDTVRYADGGGARLSISPMHAPKIEPEIVLRLKRPLAAGDAHPAAVLDAVEWLALGFEIIDCRFPKWTFQPADFVAAYGLHAALVVGERRPVDAADIPVLAEALASFKIRLLKNGELVEEGSGRNSLRSPALCVAELAAAISRRDDAEPLAADEIISSGTLTGSQFIAAGETWSTVLEGIDLQPFTLQI